MLPFNNALLSILETVQPLTPCEISTAEAGGLVLAEAAKAHWDMPGCDNSAMDGYAIAGRSSAMNSPLEIIGASYAGHSFSGTVPAGKSIRITTGAALPNGVETVIPVEDSEEDAEQLYIRTSFSVGQHVRLQGEEFQAGVQLLQAGTILKAGEISLLASAGVSRVKVYPRPRVAIISTGDELIELGETPRPDQVVNSNLHFLTTRLHECGCEPVCIGIGKDNTASLDQFIAQALDADLIISTGGVSVGEKDHVQEALSRHRFKKHFWRVAIKPGKPMLFGLLEDKPFLGLPGNPASTAMTFELFARPALKKMAGHTDCHLQKRNGILVNETKGGGDRQIFRWCRLGWNNDRYEVDVRSHQGSGQNLSIQGANALLTIPVGTTQIGRGEMVEVFLLS
jgi:molybdopterin molybdotransferase